MKLPKLRKSIDITFWSLRGSVGPNLGWIEVDQIVERRAHRVKDGDSWKWQIRNVRKIGEYDPSVYADQETLDDHGADLELL